MDTLDPKKRRLVELTDLAAKEKDQQKAEDIYRKMLLIIDEITRKPSGPN